MKKTSLNVFTNTFRAGRITRSERVEDTLLFSYSEDCRPDSAVSLTMPVRSDQYDDTPESEVRFAPAYDILSTTPYIPRDTLALTLNGTKQFPTRNELIKFIRFVTAKSERGAVGILDRIAHGVTLAMKDVQRFAREHPEGRHFADRLHKTLTRGLERSYSAR